MIENPLWATRFYNDTVTPRWIPAMMNFKESAISLLASKGVLVAHQVAAADRFRQLYEDVGGAGAKALDYTKEPVDGGGRTDPISVVQLTAGLELKRASSVLRRRYGDEAHKLVIAIAGEGKSIHDFCQTRRQRDTMTDNLRTYLDCLAELWGYAARRLQRHRERA